MSQFVQQFPQVVSTQQTFMRRVYNWMALGLGLSAFVSFSFINSPELLLGFMRNPILYYGTIIAELGLVIWISSRIHTMSNGKATFLYLLYAFLNGVTLTPILIQYTGASIFSTFFVTGATFGITSFYGYVTKKDMSSMGGLLMMGIIGMIIASIVNIFLQSTALYWIMAYIGVALGIGLTAYYTQAIKRMSQGIYKGHEMEGRGAIMGALMLYIAFIYLFIHLLQILGNRR